MFDAASLIAAGFGAESLKAAGLDPAAIRAAGLDWLTIRTAGFSAVEAKAASCDFASALASGFDVMSIVVAHGYDAVAAAGVDISFLQAFKRREQYLSNSIESDGCLLIAFIISTEEPALLHDLVSLLCNMIFQLHAKNEDVMFDWLNPKLNQAKVDVISVLTMQMARVSENSRCHITQLLCWWYSKMESPRFQKIYRYKKHSSQNEFRSMLVAVMSRLQSPPPSLNDVMTLICGATNIFECMRAPSVRTTEAAAPGAENASAAAAHDIGRTSSTDAKLRRIQGCFRIEELSDFIIIPRMMEFSTIPSLSCDLVSNFHLFCPVLLLLRFLPRKDFCTVVDILREVFSTIPNDQKLVVVSMTLHPRSTDSVAAAPRPSLEGNLVIWSFGLPKPF